ncbi:hypothetical protein RD055328_10470 [Companilactobacillus sp. RD055328]|uniref:GH25 family lysozyme n=1 Tax=Companilactobacillus sp. RD055328 TaxID=2916634 RepID=UPI001FC87AFB|nr:GH25 family lysozyme [Companilactobacillus sp. RD055328]GKQ43124.1 hypothetical protein RD055328_10470 [Companilactobacillus sp. RD055328]
MSEKVKPIYSDRRVRKHQNILITIAVTVVLLLVGSWAIVQKIQNAGRPSVNEFPILGMSIDQNDGYQDFASLKIHDIKFIYFKTTEGSSYTDDNLESNYSRIKGSEIPFGFSHTVSFDSSAENQFENIVDAVGENRGTLPFVLKVSAYGEYADSGIPKKKATKIVQALSNDIKSRYGDDCIIQVDSSSEFLTKNFNRIWYMSKKQPEASWTIWQYSTDAQIPGYASSNKYHLSVLNGNNNTLNELIQTP